MPPKKHAFDRTILLLQGGGALGAYQVGVYKGLSDNGYTPEWVISTSIGAINSAIIAGNSAKTRVKKLIGFWNTIATKFPPPPQTINNILLERMYHYFSASFTEYFGVPGFFKPRDINPLFNIESTPDYLSFYDTEDLRKTLLKFIDFDYLNDQNMRLSMGAVHVSTGKLVYFDNTKTVLTPEHVMASGALPPGFPAIKIDDEMFWDGGIYSNTQIDLLFTDDKPLKTLCFMVHLFNCYGTRPTNLDEVLKRKKDISYSSHHHQFMQVYKKFHCLRTAIRHLRDALPEKKKKDPELQQYIKEGETGVIHLVRFHYQAKPSDLSSKDYEFSLPTIQSHIHSGCTHVLRTLKNPPWWKPVEKNTGLVIYEVSERTSDTDNPFAP